MILQTVTTAALLATTPLAPPADSANLAPVARPVAATPIATDTTRHPRHHAVETSEWYARRLTIHRIGSYAMFPLFATEFILGQKLINQKTDAFAGRGNGIDQNLLTAHQVVAGGVATVFGINTITGLWNLYDSRGQAEGKKLRTTHALLMLASDAGFAATGLIAGKAADGNPDDARRHRNVALVSMAPATAGTLLMWLKHH